MSRRHFQVKREGGFWRIRDLDSSNGTRVNGECLSKATLHEGDVIVAGDTRFQVSISHPTVRLDLAESNIKTDYKHAVRRTVRSPNSAE